jgi:hypothetical protein
MNFENKDFKCSKCGKKVEELFMFGPVIVPDQEIGMEYCDKCWKKHPENQERKTFGSQTEVGQE